MTQKGNVVESSCFTDDVYIWAAAARGKSCFDWLAVQVPAQKIVAFCDNNPASWGKKFCGLPVYAPGDLKFTRKEKSVLVMATDRFDCVARQVGALGVREDDLYVYSFVNPLMTKSGQNSVHDLEKIYSAEDEVTKKIVALVNDGFLNTRMLFPYSRVKGLGENFGYFEDGIVEKITADTFTLFDIGSFDGKSITQIYAVFGSRLQKAYAFEPSCENFLLVKNYLDSCALPCDITLHNFALGEMTTEKSFSSEAETFRQTGDMAGKKVKVHPLDDIDVCYTGTPILKMDVEGAELNVLQGAKKFIARHEPILAICVYHNERDIQILPQYVLSISDNYKFFLRGGAHAVCYAIPLRLLR